MTISAESKNLSATTTSKRDAREAGVFMRKKPAVLMLFSLWLLFAVAAPLAAHSDRDGEGHVASAAFQEQDEEASFTLTRLVEDPKKYSLVVTGSNERTVSGSFTVDQLQILRAMMVEAQKIALSGEAVGAKTPITTRFSDKHERAFIVDVEKAANQSQLFLTLKTEQGRRTWNAGKIIRSTRREDGFFFKLLTHLESVLPKATAQSPK